MYALRNGSARGPAGEPGPLTISPLTGRAGLRLDGEADLTSRHELQQALAGLPPGAAEIHFELARLKFIDVAATRMLIACALRPRHPRLILHHPPPSLQRLIPLLWPDASAQFPFSPDSGFEDEPVAAHTGPRLAELALPTTASRAAVSPPGVSRTGLADSPAPALTAATPTATPRTGYPCTGYPGRRLGRRRASARFPVTSLNSHCLELSHYGPTGRAVLR